MRQRAITSLYALAFLFTIHFSISVYINSSFLGTILPTKFVGIVYTLGSLFTIVAFFGIPKILREAGDYKTTMRLLTLLLLSLVAIIIFKNPIIVVAAFIVNVVAVSLVYFNIDVILENFTTNKETGKVRGSFLTASNIAWVMAPLLASLILADTEIYRRVYIVAALLLLPTLYILRRNFKDFKDPTYRSISLLSAIKGLLVNKNLRLICLSMFILHFFFSWMVIYMPIYLHEYIGFNWREIGIMLSIALLPYVVLELPLGKLADTRWGEKEILSIGFAISALGAAGVFFIEGGDFFTWTAILVVTRIGASMVEIMSETYFFKVVDAAQIDVLSFFRMMRPFAYIVGPLSGTLLLLFVSYKTLFLILGAITLYGLRYSLALKDTK
ncbi:MAG: MFS transporter [bacterium]|nr:MFS transporter [bacterium]